jgi:hypothetical protein
MTGKRDRGDCSWRYLELISDFAECPVPLANLCRDAQVGDLLLLLSFNFRFVWFPDALLIDFSQTAADGITMAFSMVICLE